MLSLTGGLLAAGGLVEPVHAQYYGPSYYGPSPYPFFGNFFPFQGGVNAVLDLGDFDNLGVEMHLVKKFFQARGQRPDQVGINARQ